MQAPADNSSDVNRMAVAFQLFDEANSRDPRKEVWEGETYPYELLYSLRMSEILGSFEPQASEVLQLAARAQHICRWELPRESYPMTRVGYLNWRNDAKAMHAQKASHCMLAAGYDEQTIERVQTLLLKKGLKQDAEVQTLEDVICLVFLKYYLADFAEKHSEEKVADILQKTKRKMSARGLEAAGLTS